MRAKKHYIESHECSAYVVGDRIFTIGDEYTYQPGAEKAILKNVYNIDEVDRVKNFSHMTAFMAEYGIARMLEIENYRPSACDWSEISLGLKGDK